MHIALSPEEAESLRQRLGAIRKDEPFDLVISGSPEHLDALRRAHSHYDEKREMLRAKHGPDYDEFENVRAELDTLSSELHMLTDHVCKFSSLFFPCLNVSRGVAHSKSSPFNFQEIMHIQIYCLYMSRELARHFRILNRVTLTSRSSRLYNSTQISVNTVIQLI